MATMRRPRVSTVTTQPGYRLALEFINGTTYVIDLSADVRKLSGLRPLQEGAAFASVRVSEGGWSVEWIELDIQIGADTLWMDALEQNALNEGQRAFLRWRSRNGLSLSAAADALGLTSRTVSAYGTGARPVPKTVLLACEGWEAQALVRSALHF